MKAICVQEIGGPDVLRFEEMPNPQPGPGQVLICQRAVAVNFIDTYFRSGLYKAPSLPFVPGVEGAGEIAALGEGAASFQVGERVAYVANLGAYAELRVVAADRLVKVPLLPKS
jgi:NADPH2:quinone reductase